MKYPGGPAEQFLPPKLGHFVMAQLQAADLCVDLQVCDTQNRINWQVFGP
jgi:hypothetical protein